MAKGNPYATFRVKRSTIGKASRKSLPVFGNQLSGPMPSSCTDSYCFSEKNALHDLRQSQWIHTVEKAPPFSSKISALCLVIIGQIFLFCILAAVNKSSCRREAGHSIRLQSVARLYQRMRALQRYGHAQKSVQSRYGLLLHVM